MQWQMRQECEVRWRISIHYILPELNKQWQTPHTGDKKGIVRRITILNARIVMGNRIDMWNIAVKIPNMIVSAAIFGIL